MQRYNGFYDKSEHGVFYLVSDVEALQAENKALKEVANDAVRDNTRVYEENKALKENLYSCLRWFKMRGIYKAWVLKNDKGLEILKPIKLLLDLQTPTEPKDIR
tara:strand:+ start:308 stop:619 length:312 start_codon:yes stop_codon:yes gene_type:complete